MDKQMFDELLASVQQMDGIVNGDQKASRTFEFPNMEVKAIRERMGMPQDK